MKTTDPFFPLVLLTDVVLTSPANGEALVYESATNKWVNSAIAGGGASLLGELDDVDVASANDGQVLTFLGGSVNEWIADDLPSVTYGNASEIPYMNAGGTGFDYHANNFYYDRANNTLSIQNIDFTSAGNGLADFAGLGGSLNGPTLACFVWYEVAGNAFCVFQGDTSVQGDVSLSSGYTFQMAQGTAFFTVSPSTLTSTQSYTLPPEHGSEGSVLTDTDGSGALEWVASLGAVDLTDAVDDAELVYRAGSVDEWVAKPKKGTTFPDSPEDGDEYYRTDHGELYRWDALRSKWLGEMRSHTFGRGLNANVPVPLKMTGNVTCSASDGYYIANDVTIVGYELANQNSTTVTFDINRAGTAVTTITLTSQATKSDFTISDDFSGGSTMDAEFATYSGGGNVRNPMLTVYYRRRAT